MTFFTSEQKAIHVSRGQSAPVWLVDWWNVFPGEKSVTSDTNLVMMSALRERPRLIFIDARTGGVSATEKNDWLREGLDLCRRLKRDAFTGIVPVAMLVPAAALPAAFDAGADEVLPESVTTQEAVARLTALLRKSDRDTDVHPSTRLAGSREISADLTRRILSGEKFAACYADLDHFKEFNDRYGFQHGDQVIQLLARLLHDVVKGLCGSDGFVGHIGGDDFLFTIPLVAVPRVCDEIVTVFEELIPWQYSAQDRRVGYFFGKDRRGQLHRVPLMTLSVGVVTNQRRHFTRAVEVSELATEMKSYAKTLPGSVWIVDRRREDAVPESVDGALEHQRMLSVGDVRAGGIGKGGAS